jgi:hypothetical protein
MRRGIMTIKTLVSKVGFLDEYINLPVIKDNVAIGVITYAEELEYGYELTMTLWNMLEITDDKPSAIVLN